MALKHFMVANEKRDMSLLQIPANLDFIIRVDNHINLIIALRDDMFSIAFHPSFILQQSIISNQKKL